MKVKNNIFNETDGSRGFFQLLFSKPIKWFFLGIFFITFIFSILIFMKASSAAEMLGDNIFAQSIKLSLSDSVEQPILFPEENSQIYLVTSFNESLLGEHEEKLIITKKYVYEKKGEDYVRTSVDEYREELKQAQSLNKILLILLFILVPGLTVFFLLYFSIKWLILMSLVYGIFSLIEKLFKIHARRNILVMLAIISSFVVTIIESILLMQFYSIINIIIWSTLIFIMIFFIGALIISKVQVMPKRQKHLKNKTSTKTTTKTAKHSNSKNNDFIELKDL